MSHFIPDRSQTKPCTKCGIVYPRTTEFYHRDKQSKDGLSRRCKCCAIKNAVHWSQENPEKVHRNQARYYKENSDKIQERQARYRAENPDKVREQKARWREENPDKDRESKMHWWKENPDYYVCWREENRDKVREGQARWQKENSEKTRMTAQRREARKRGVFSSLTINQWRWLLEQSNNSCVYCGKHERECGTLAQEHVIPLIQGGEYTIFNIRPACKPCNSKKQARTPEQAGMVMLIKIDLVECPE